MSFVVLKPNYIAWDVGYPQQIGMGESCVQVAYDEFNLAMNDVNCEIERSPLCKEWYNAGIFSKFISLMFYIFSYVILILVESLI